MAHSCTVERSSPDPDSCSLHPDHSLQTSFSLRIIEVEGKELTLLCQHRRKIKKAYAKEVIKGTCCNKLFSLWIKALSDLEL